MHHLIMKSAGALAMAAASGALAHGTSTPADAGAEEILVTAQKRAQVLTDVPIAISAFDETFLERGRTQTVADLVAFTPGVSGTTVATTTPRITIRGVSTEDFGVGSDPALGVYVDDVYLGRAVSSISDLFDVERVEVIKGPQGSVFGRNTTAGAISIITNKPDADTTESRLDASYGRFDLLDVRGAVNVPLGGGWAGRVAGSTRNRDGFNRNTLGGRIGAIESHAGRATLGYDGAGPVTGYASFEYRSARGEPGPYINPFLVGTDPFGPISSNLTNASTDRARDDIDAYRATLRLEAELAPELSLASITTYNGFDNRYLEDTDASPLTLLHFGTDGEQDSYSQELRLDGEAARLTWFLGASAARDVIRSTQFALFAEEDFCGILFAASCTDAVGAPGDPRVLEASIAGTRNTSLALFGDATLELTDRLDVTAGLRFSRDRKRFRVRLPAGANLLGPVIIVPPATDDLAAFGRLDPDGTLRQRYASSSWQPRVAITYDLSDDLTAYASASRGYKAGGFNQLSPGPAFSPEKIWSYEAGLKGSLLDGRVRFDLAAYHFDYADLQVLIDQAGGTLTRNAGSASGDGVEFSASARLADGVTLSAGAAYQDAQYDRFTPNAGQDFSGNRLVRAPEWSANLVADAQVPVTARADVLARMEVSYRSRQFFDPSNSAFESQRGYTLVNASAGVAIDDRVEVRGFVQNLFGKAYLVDTSVIAPDLLAYSQRGERRTYGLQLLARF